MGLLKTSYCERATFKIKEEYDTNTAAVCSKGSHWIKMKQLIRTLKSSVHGKPR